MKAALGHIGINLSNSTKSFTLWKDLCTYFGFTISADPGHFHADDGHTYLCISAAKKKHLAAGFHRKRTGLNHVAFRVRSAKEVDRFVEEFLKQRHISPLYGGAKAYPEYAQGYYAVYFEDPDRIKVEVVCEPK